MAKIRINESRLNEIIKESINNVLNEGMTDDFFGGVHSFQQGVKTFRNTDGSFANRLSKGAQTTNLTNTYVRIDNAYDDLVARLKEGVKNGFITEEEFESLRGPLSSIWNLIENKASEAGVGYGNN